MPLRQNDTMLLDRPHFGRLIELEAALAKYVMFEIVHADVEPRCIKAASTGALYPTRTARQVLLRLLRLSALPPAPLHCEGAASSNLWRSSAYIQRALLLSDMADWK